MSLRLTVLGGAAAWPNPGQGCSSFLVQHDDNDILLDCGPATLPELRNHVDYTRIRAIIISHMHSDHILDLIPYRYGLKYGPERPERKIPLWLPPGASERLGHIAAAIAGTGEDVRSFFHDVFEITEYEPHKPLAIGGVALSFARTQHPVPCFAVRMEDGDRQSIVYTADTGAIQPLRELAAGATVLVAEATMEHHDAKPVAERVHLTPSEAGELAAAAGARTLVLTHLWCERPDERVVMEAARTFSGEILVAKPALTIDA